jgi:hypothetical protein
MMKVIRTAHAASSPAQAGDPVFSGLGIRHDFS